MKCIQLNKDHSFGPIPQSMYHRQTVNESCLKNSVQTVQCKTTRNSGKILNDRLSAGQKENKKMLLFAEEKFMLTLSWTQLEQSFHLPAPQNNVSRTSPDRATKFFKTKAINMNSH